jgi:hypothetical protein
MVMKKIIIRKSKRYKNLWDVKRGKRTLMGGIPTKEEATWWASDFRKKKKRQR